MTDYNDVLQRIKKIYSSMEPESQALLRQILQEISDKGESKTYEDLWLADYKEIPVDKETFLTDSYYLGESNNNGKAIYPRWMEVFKELEQAGNQYYEIVFTGATRTGKTSTAVSDACYQLYRLMCLRDPQKYFGLKSVSRLSFFFFNLTATLARTFFFIIVPSLSFYKKNYLFGFSIPLVTVSAVVPFRVITTIIFVGSFSQIHPV